MIADKTYRIAIVGASSLAGKELSDALSESIFAASSFTLLDEDNATGQIAAAGDEISFIQKIDASSFEHMDVVFFAGDADAATRHWRAARSAGAGIVDLTNSLEGQDGVPVLAPWISSVSGPNSVSGANNEGTGAISLETSAVVAAHPAAVMLGLVAKRLAAKASVRSIAATILEPASQYGRTTMDELHQQTVSLLSFQSLPREQYDAQVAFNLLPSLGEDAKIKLGQTEARIETQYGRFAGNMPELAIQLIHAPVFHSYVVSMFAELDDAMTVEQIELALLGEHIDLVSQDSEPPSNLSAAGQDQIIVRVESAVGDGASKRLKLLLAADNLKLAAANAIACARELVQLRPLGKVQ